MASVRNSTPGVERSCEMLAIKATYEALRLEPLKLLRERTDIANFLSHHHVNEGAGAHDRQPGGICRMGSVDLAEKRGERVRDGIQPLW